MVKTLRELAADENLSYHTIYYWLKIGLLKSSATVGKQKVFLEEDVKRYKKIIELRKEGFELSAIKRKLDKK